MKLQKSSLTHKFVLLTPLALILGGIGFFLPHTHANSDLSASNTLNQSKGLLLDSVFDGNKATVESTKLSANAPQVMADFGNSRTQSDTKELYLSPDRRLVAITFDPIGEEAGSFTYISDINGTQVTSVYSGRFVSWAPDSSKALLYLAPMGAPWVRRIYALDVQGKYYDTGLPNGTINADISPVDGSMLYSLTSGGTDNSTIFVRDPQGNDKSLVKGDSNVLTWVRWSPKGDKIAFLKSDLHITFGQESIWTMNSDGSGQEKASDVIWNYPPVWSPDGTRIAFSNSGNIWEYDAVGKSVKSITNLKEGGAGHPSYSGDGKTIVFSSGVSGEQQIWAAKDGGVVQLTTGSQEKDYPILP
jgi:dipeptidyl aminopeptidase/acylaminoacyl peptidase